MNRKHLASIAVGAVVSGGLLAAALWNVDFHALGATLAQARLPYVLAMAAIGVALLGVRAWRWRLLLPAEGAGLKTYFRLVTIGLAVNNVLPLRLGEVARALFAAEELKLPVLTVFASILIERLLDALTILTLFMAASSLHTSVPGVAAMRTALIPLYGAVLAAFIGAFLVETLLERSRALAARLRGHPRLERLVSQIILGLKPLKSPATLATLVFASALLWMSDAGNYFCGTRAIPLGIDVPYSYTMILLASAGFSTVVPTLPGYIGAFELVVSQALMPLGVSEDRAFGYALTVHMVSYLIVTVMGMWFLYREGTSLMDVWRRAKEDRP